MQKARSIGVRMVYIAIITKARGRRTITGYDEYIARAIARLYKCTANNFRTSEKRVWPRQCCEQTAVI